MLINRMTKSQLEQAAQCRNAAAQKGLVLAFQSATASDAEKAKLQKQFE